MYIGICVLCGVIRVSTRTRNGVIYTKFLSLNVMRTLPMPLGESVCVSDNVNASPRRISEDIYAKNLV